MLRFRRKRQNNSLGIAVGGGGGSSSRGGRQHQQQQPQPPQKYCRRQKGTVATTTTAAVDMILLARQGKFDELLHRLEQIDEDNPGPTRFGSMYITNSEEAAFPLHAVLRFRPPVPVVDALIRKLQLDCSTLAPGVLVPEESRESTLHQTPLHVAVASQCSLSVIERLLEGESLCIPSMTKDGLHRFPLHWACAMPHSAGRFSLQRSKDVDYRWEVIHFLLDQYPVAAVIPDVYNQTPLDYARNNKLDMSIIDLVEQAAIEYERYSPLKRRYRRKDMSMREHTEVTSVVSESEHVPHELPMVIESSHPPVSPLFSPQQGNENPLYQWEVDDDISTLGGDYPSSASSTPTRKQPISHVTSLFSSAFGFSPLGNNSSSNKVEDVSHTTTPNTSVVGTTTTATVGTPMSTTTTTAPPTTTATTASTVLQTMKSLPLLLGREEVSESSGDHSQPRLVTPSPKLVTSQTKRMFSPVRIKSLMTGKIRIKLRNLYDAPFNNDALSITPDMKGIRFSV
jgi:hypothetical protein